MKKTILSLSLFILAVGSAMLITSCGKDETAPIIYLVGDDPFELEMRTAYVDPGFTAEDDEDGDVTSSVVTNSSGVNANLPGHYTVNYSVSDKEGNTGVESRDVHVHATAAAMVDSYSVIDTCGSGASAQIFNYAQSITTMSSTRIKFNKFADYTGNTGIYADIDEDGTITMPLQQANGIGSLNENHTFQGTGYVTQNGFYLEYIDTNLSQGNSTAGCHAHFTR